MSFNYISLQKMLYSIVILYYKQIFLSHLLRTQLNHGCKFKLNSHVFYYNSERNRIFTRSNSYLSLDEINVDLLDYVRAQFLWNSWIPLVSEFTSSFYYLKSTIKSFNIIKYTEYMHLCPNKPVIFMIFKKRLQRYLMKLIQIQC